MDIRFTNRALQNVFEDDSLLEKHCAENGSENPVKSVAAIRLTMSHLASAPSFYDVPEYFRPHALTVDRKGQYATDVDESHRIIVRPDHKDEKGFNWENQRKLTKIVIVHLFKDYHRRNRRKR